MKTLVFILVALAGCSTPGRPAIDSGSDDADGGSDGSEQCYDCCNPIAPPGQQACATGQRCTWVVLHEGSTLGDLECVPDADVPLGGGCTWGPPGVTTGFDDCANGGICVEGTCLDICGFDGSQSNACPDGYACMGYDDLFQIGPIPPVAGACVAVP